MLPGFLDNYVPQWWLHALSLGLVLPDTEKIGLAKSLFSLFKQLLKNCDYKQTFNVILSPVRCHLRVGNRENFSLDSPLRTLADI